MRRTATLWVACVAVVGLLALGWWLRGLVEGPSGLASGGVDASPSEVTLTGGSCTGVEAAIAATANLRRSAGLATPAASLAGQLGTLIALESPYAGFDPGFNGSLTLQDVEASQRFGDLAGFVAGYSRSFIAPESWRGEGFVTFEVYEFRTSAAAVDSLEQRLRFRCEDTAQTFMVSEVPDAVGASLRGSAPPVEETILFVRGNRRYLVERGLGEPPRNHDQAIALAVAASQIAR